MVSKQLHFITGNKNKLAEVQAILGDTVDLKNTSLDLVEIQGDLEEVTIDKCKRAAVQVNHDIATLYVTN
jgi:inosine triphosphate pyrophosphatase